MIVDRLLCYLIQEFWQNEPKASGFSWLARICSPLPAVERSREGPKYDLAIAMLLTPALPLRSWPATPEAFLW